MESQELDGVIPALVTPVGPEGELDLQTIPELVNFLLSRRVSGLFVAGSTGEGFYLTPEEKKLLVESVVRAVHRRVPVIVHLASMNFREILDLAEHARRVGADMVSSVVPFYYSYSLEEIRDYYLRIAEVSGLPLIAYALVQVMNPAVPPREFVRMLLEVKGLYGIKFSCSDMYYLQRLKQHSPEELRYYGGWDSLALAMFMMGAVGVIGSQYNALPEIWIALYSAFVRGDLARARQIHDRLSYFMSQYESVPPAARAKYILRLRGVDVGGQRLPQRPLSREQKETVRRVFEEMKRDQIFGPILENGA
ncbi:MAG: dihydrodipicolinate synthase family protein [Acidobacteria bacterium]|nr:dihydrodipicolinate synthase family protein [Acidobacteriota bacterium]